MTQDFNSFNFGFIGLGLIGGSIAKAIRYTYKNAVITAFNRSEGPRNAAFQEGIANVITDTIDSSFSQCDYIFLCTPVEYNEYYLELLKPIIKKECIITDVGSVKGNIHNSVVTNHMEENFIGGHPMAGSEKTGYEHSYKDLCSGAMYPITPTSRSSFEKVEEYKALIGSLGFIPIIMDYNTHDYSVAGISHVPHIISSELVNLVSENDTTDQYMKVLAAGGFRDTTRIAASSPEVWEQICITNSENITVLLEKYIERLDSIKTAIKNKDKTSIHSMFENSKKYRDTF